MARETKAGIYRITNTVNGKVYIGSSLNVDGRLGNHRAGYMSNVHLQNSIRKYGIDNFKFEKIISVLDKAALIEYEQMVIDSYHKSERYNICTTAGSCLGIKHSDQAISNMAAASRAKAADPEYQANHAAAMKSLFADPEYQANRAAMFASPEWRAKMKALVADPKWIARHSAAMRANADDPEWQERVAAVNRERAADPDHIARLAATWSDPTVAKARVTRQGVEVTVEGKQGVFKSVHAAFEALGLPTETKGIHIRFRIKLKKSRREVFTHEGKQYLFELID